MTWSAGDVPCVAETVSVHVPADGSDVIVFQDETRCCHRLAGTARSIWSAIDGARSVGDIVDVVAASHGVDPDDIGDDVVGALERLRVARVLTSELPRPTIGGGR